MARRQAFFINPPRKRRRRATTRKTTTRRKTPKRGKDGRFMKSIRSQKTGKPVTRAAWKRSGFRRNKMAKRRLPPRTKSGRFRKRAGGTRRATTTARRRRTYRRNPPLFRGILGAVMQAGVGGAGVSAGKIANRQGVSLLNLDPTSPIGIAAQAGIAIAAGVLAKQFRMRGPFVDGLVYGAMSGAVESAIKMVAPAQAAALLGEYPYDNLNLAAYPIAALPPMTEDQNAAMGAYATGYPVM